MAKWGRCDYRQLQELQKKMQQLEEIDSSKLCEDIAKELALRLLTKTKQRTPVGVYKDRTGGTLRRNWDVTQVKRSGYSYSIEVYNDTEYAIYVEFGHRTRNHQGWVPGRFMLTISEKEIDSIAPKVIQKKLEAKLREVFK